MAVFAGCQNSGTAATPQTDNPSASSSASSPEVKLQFDKAAAWAHLLKQCSFGPRPPSTEAHIKCRDWIAEEMKKHCENVRLQEFTHKWTHTRKNVTMWNIIGEQNWEKAKTRVLLLAHWDTRPFSNEDLDPNRQDQPIIGANDGASGVAVLLELMRVLKDKNPDLGIMYLMTDGEDLGPGLEEMFLGAVHFSKNLPAQKPAYGILLDMIGTKSVRIAKEPNSIRFAPDLVDNFYHHAQALGYSGVFPSSMGSEILDDHLSINEAGIPTMDLIDFEHLSHWHTTTDTPEHCSAESLNAVGKVLESWFLQSPPYQFKRR
jgi:glutaminyl-peptide cyclotransferase